jgi:hypothetical protein
MLRFIPTHPDKSYGAYVYPSRSSTCTLICGLMSNWSTMRSTAYQLKMNESRRQLRNDAANGRNQIGMIFVARRCSTDATILSVYLRLMLRSAQI